MRLHYLRGQTLKVFERLQAWESRYGRGGKRRLELARRRDRIQRANCLKIFPELKGLP